MFVLEFLLNMIDCGRAGVEQLKMRLGEKAQNLWVVLTFRTQSHIL